MRSRINPMQLRVMTIALFLTAVCTAAVFACWEGAIVTFGVTAAALEGLAQLGDHHARHRS